jgi:L-ascorbate metabolism protein UlaG (beta-lactamase superfamily)
MGIIIRWWGHACFELIYGGISLTIDPHDGASIGIKRPGALSDYVIMSHDHFDHNAYRVVLKEGGKYLLMATSINTLGPFRVKGIETFHDKERGRRRGRNVAYVIEVPDGVKVFHAGDLGHILSPDQVREVGSPHIAMLPIGGTFTIDYEEAIKVFEALGSKVMIPMHYWVKGVNLPLYPVERLIERVSSSISIYLLDGNEVEASLKNGVLAVTSKYSCKEAHSGRIYERCEPDIRERAIVILKLG